MKIVSSCVTVADLNRAQIANIELLTKDRMPFPGLDVIYCVMPRPENLSKIEVPANLLPKMARNSACVPI